MKNTQIYLSLVQRSARNLETPDGQVASQL